MRHGVTFNFSSAKVCSPAIFEICFSYAKDIWIDEICTFTCAITFPLTAIL